ncbi:TPA: histidine phosphatase family protein [Vibrio cholerae]|nr:histidine phosphatase family protein [Vibrio parahaemolyticus]EGR0525354.1 histidine phosphatase family protein [Vibrio cholerae]MBY8217614.1 histidine phosphatase family protein [Vibrio fluvialis]EGR0601153.1 histidine phosphatase family protein [Vibrio cholerae]EGR2490291.1 histidine phosphatase family protein [Vibrio cholerae]
MRLILLRHGETLWNRESRLQGHDNSELSERGIKQAQAVKYFINQLAPKRVITSDLGRAVQTSEIIGYPGAIKCQEIRELNMGEWTGCRKPDLLLNQADKYHNWRAGSYTPRGGENWFDFCDRIDVALRTKVYEGQSDLLAVVHSGVIRAACKAFLSLSPEHILPASPGTLTIFNFDSDPFKSVKLEAYNIGSLVPDEDVAD